MNIFTTEPSANLALRPFVHPNVLILSTYYVTYFFNFSQIIITANSWNRIEKKKHSIPIPEYVWEIWYCRAISCAPCYLVFSRGSFVFEAILDQHVPLPNVYPKEGYDITMDQAINCAGSPGPGSYILLCMLPLPSRPAPSFETSPNPNFPHPLQTSSFFSSRHKSRESLLVLFHS